MGSSAAASQSKREASFATSMLSDLLSPRHLRQLNQRRKKIAAFLESFYPYKSLVSAPTLF